MHYIKQVRTVLNHETGRTEIIGTSYVRVNKDHGHIMWVNDLERATGFKKYHIALCVAKLLLKSNNHKGAEHSILTYAEEQI